MLSIGLSRSLSMDGFMNIPPPPAVDVAISSEETKLKPSADAVADATQRVCSKNNAPLVAAMKGLFDTWSP